MVEFIMYTGLIALYLAALIAYLSIAPFIVAAYAAATAIRLLWEYGRVVVGVLFRRTPEFVAIPPFRPENEPVPAYRQYFYGPAWRDVRQVRVLAVRRLGTTLGDSLRSASLRYLTAPAWSPLAAIPFGLTVCAGLLVGAVLAAPIAVLLFAVHAFLVFVLQGVPRATAGILRAVDRAVLRSKDLHKGMLCPHCHLMVRYPSYLCQCQRLHADVRPGRYGVLKRRCACREKLPTLILTGSHRLQAMCTHAHCRERMSAGTGRVSETVLPLIGGTAAGKTQLMAAVRMTLHASATTGGPQVRSADDETENDYKVLREVLEINGHTRGTPRTQTRAHSLLYGRGRSERLVHIFDTAGERFATREDTDALRYAAVARLFVFVLDPLSVPAFWDGLTAGQRSGIDRTIASDMPPEVVFRQAVQAVIQMGADLKRSRLCVAVSKTDLLREQGVVTEEHLGDSASAAEWLSRDLGLGNLVRSMRHEFRQVRFFFTAAVAEEAGGVDASISPLVDWCLGARHLHIPR